MGCQSQVNIGDYLTFSICTHDPDTGELTDADAAPIWRLYEDETALPILMGVMAILDNANTIGFYTERILCSVGNGFEDEKSYTIYIQATVDGDTGGIAYSFRASTAPNDLTAIEIADAVLSRPISNTEGAAIFRTLTGAIAKLVNHVRVAGGNLIIYETDDVTPYGTQALTTDAAADPIVRADTV